jgi:transglutaminase-like putative cysteine protease
LVSIGQTGEKAEEPVVFEGWRTKVSVEDKPVIFRLVAIIAVCIFFSCSTLTAEIIYRNPRVYNVTYTFELHPQPEMVDYSKDLKLWIPVPREWESQKSVRILSAKPEPHAEFTDPEHGNRIFFWDFGREPGKSLYVVELKYRLKSYEARIEIDPQRVGPYDPASREYKLYTRSTHTVQVTPRVEELARQIIGDEKSTYLQAKRVFDFVTEKMRYKIRMPRLCTTTTCMLDSAKSDRETGELYYEGACAEQTTLFVSLCRALGIPARGVTGFIGWRPWMREKDFKLRYEGHTKLTPDGLAATRYYGAFEGHRWAEFYLPNYGWFPVDITWSVFDGLSSDRLILTKGSDVIVGPHAPRGDLQEYSDQWTPLHDGRVEVIGWGVWNSKKVRISKAKTLHHSDPFPTDAFSEYFSNLDPKTGANKGLSRIRKGLLMTIDAAIPDLQEARVLLPSIFSDKPWLRQDKQVFTIHMLRQVVGDEKFGEIVNSYRQMCNISPDPVPTARFQRLAARIYGQSLNWFWDQWLDRDQLPLLGLTNVEVSKVGENWQLRGQLSQVQDSLFRLPIELELRNETGIERKKIWLEAKNVSFEFKTPFRPQSILADPDYDILKIQKITPLLSDFWNSYPNYVLVYGDVMEGEANRRAAARFNDDWLGLNDDIIRPDVDIDLEDLKGKCVILFGRPETNRAIAMFQDAFPIRFKGDQFYWKGETYGQPTQGVAQVTKNPMDPASLLILYAGNSEESTLQICDSHLYDPDASFAIFDGDEILTTGDWEPTGDLVWKFEANDP